MRVGFGDVDARAQVAAPTGSSVTRARDPEHAQQCDHDRRAHAGDTCKQCVGPRLIAVDPALALVRIARQRGIRGRIRVQIVDEAVEQFGGGVEIEQRHVGAGFQRFARCPQPVGQLGLVGFQLFGHAHGIGGGQNRFAGFVEERRDLLEVRFDGFDSGRRAGLMQPVHQLMQGVKARRCSHELAVQARQAAASHPRGRGFEHGDAADRFEAHDVGDKACVGGLDLRAIDLARQRRRNVFDERTKTAAYGGAHLFAGELREHQTADCAGTDNADHDFRDARRCGNERAVWMLCRRKADQRGGVAGQHEAIRAEISVARGTRGTNADPDRRRRDEEFRLLRKQADQRQHDDEPDHRAADPVEALREHHAALRLHHDEDGRHRGTRLRQVEFHRYV
jgi:hypothetical protein